MSTALKITLLVSIQLAIPNQSNSKLSQKLFRKDYWNIVQ